MNLFSNRQQVQLSPRTTSDAKDIEALLPKGLDTPPKPTDPLPESPQQICGLPVQLVSGAAYCTGESILLQQFDALLALRHRTLSECTGSLHLCFI